MIRYQPLQEGSLRNGRKDEYGLAAGSEYLRSLLSVERKAAWAVKWLSKQLKRKTDHGANPLSVTLVHIAK